MDVGKKIQMYRKQAGMTQKQLAENIGVVTGTIQQYELEKRQPRLEQLERIADLLGVMVSDLTGENSITNDQNEGDKAYILALRKKSGYNIRNLRERLGLNQEEFSKSIGISKNMLSGYENGVKTPDIDFINIVKKNTGCSANYLLGLTSVRNEDPFDFESRFRLNSSAADELLKICGNTMFHHFLNTGVFSRIMRIIEERSFAASVDYQDRKALVWECLEELSCPISDLVDELIDNLQNDPLADELLAIMRERYSESNEMRLKYQKIKAGEKSKDPFEEFRKSKNAKED